MKKTFLTFSLSLMCIFCYSQNENDSIRYYSMMNFIIENKSLIKSYMKFIENHDDTEEYDVNKLCVIQDEVSKIFLTNPESNQVFYKYYKGLRGNELEKAIFNDYFKYQLEEENTLDKDFLERMNKYLDNILRKSKSVDTTKQYWGILFSDSFYDYTSATIYNVYQLKNETFVVSLEIVFLFDEKNRIKMIDIMLLMS